MDWQKYDKENPPLSSYLLLSNGNYVTPGECGIHKGEPYFRNDNGILDDVTHWMDFPKPPKDE